MRFETLASLTTLELIACGVGILVFMNALTFLAFGNDKSRAESGDWRIPEKTLLTLAFFGGSLGAVAARRHFRHKTRKQPFSSLLNTIVHLHLVLLSILIVPEFRQWALDLLAR